MSYALTEQERQVFWTYHNNNRRIAPVVTFMGGSVNDAQEILKRIETKLMQQANTYLRLT